MGKTHSQYVCQQCGYSQVGWAGKCPNCGNWNTLVETVITEPQSQKAKGKTQTYNSKVVKLSEIKEGSTKRISTKILELDRVLGGGLVAGQVVLIAGEPGIGKSTLLTQISYNLKSVLYVCGEESATQVKIRADRLGVKKSDIQLLEDTDVDSVVNTIGGLQGQPLQAVIVDSIQTMATLDLSGMAGSVGQVRECAFRLLKAAKEKNIPLFLVGHVTKEGTVAGPAVLAHIVDTVLWFEGDKTQTLRLIRAVKNRFGPTDEVGIFEMQDGGLFGLSNPEKIFLTKISKEVPGSVVSSVLQGSRPLLVEIQGLVVPTKMAFPKRVAQGFDSKRFELLLAVLTRRCGIPLYEYDCFVNVAGGVIVREPSIDLAICLSLVSAFTDRPLPKGAIAIGEVGLIGEVREVVAQEKRIKEARRLGFTKPITSREIRFLNEAIKKYIGSGQIPK